MSNRKSQSSWLVCSLAVAALLCAGLAAAQAPAAPAHPASPARAAAPARPSPDANRSTLVSDRELASTQQELIRLLKLSPTLTTVVARDPSLLSDQEYVSRNNPQLAEFLTAHPEVARNPEFYLFTHVHLDDGTPDEALERAVWPELLPRERDSWSASDVIDPIAAMLAFACFLGAVVFLTRLFIDGRRWGRIFRLQSEVHGRLIEKFGSNQELAGYMDTEAGKRFLEAAPIPLRS